MIIGVRGAGFGRARSALGEGRVDQEALVEMFSKWDENGDRELDRAEFAAIFGPSIADAERAEARRRADERAVIAAKAVEENVCRGGGGADSPRRKPPRRRSARRSRDFARSSTR